METSEREIVTPDQLVELLGSKDYRVVGRAFELLIEAGEEGMDAVIRGLAHSEARIRRGCAEFMDHQGTDQCFDILREVAANDPIPYVRRVATHSLGCQRCKSAPLEGDTISFLIERAFADTNKRVRYEAVAGMMFQPPDTRIAAALQTLMAQETDRELLRLARDVRQRHDPAYRQEIIEEARARSHAIYEQKRKEQADEFEMEL